MGQIGARIIFEAVGSESLTKKIVGALGSAGWVLAPRIPSEQMVEAAWAAALAEDARGVWGDAGAV